MKVADLLAQLKSFFIKLFVQKEHWKLPKYRLKTLKMLRSLNNSDTDVVDLSLFYKDLFELIFEVLNFILVKWYAFVALLGLRFGVKVLFGASWILDPLSLGLVRNMTGHIVSFCDFLYWCFFSFHTSTEPQLFLFVYHCQMLNRTFAEIDLYTWVGIIMGWMICVLVVTKLKFLRAFLYLLNDLCFLNLLGINQSWSIACHSF